MYSVAAFAQFFSHELSGPLRDVFRDAVFDHRVGQNIDQVCTVDPAPHMNGQAFSRVFIH